MLIWLAATPVFAQQGIPELPEPNSSGNPTPLHVGEQAFGTIDGGTDLDDWYVFTLTAAQDIRAWTSPGFVQPIGDTRLQLRDANGSLIIEVDDGSVATHGFYSLMTLGNVAAGTYHLSVRGWQAATIGSYTLDLVSSAVGSLVPRVAPRPAFSGSEPNDPRPPLLGIATASGLGTRNEGVLSQGGNGAGYGPAGGADYDFFSFSVPATGIVTLVSGPPVLLTTPPPVSNTIVFLVDSSFQLLAVNDDAAGSLYSRIRHELAAGIYYAAIRGFGANDVGSYSLEIIGPPTPLGQSTAVAESPALPGCVGSSRAVHLGIRADTLNGFPNVRPEQPLLGSQFVLDITNLPPGGRVYTLIGTQIGLVDLHLFNANWVGCRTEVNFVGGILQFLWADGSGNCFWSLPIPATPDLLGEVFEAQAAGEDPATGLISLSNRCSIRVGLSH